MNAGNANQLPDNPIPPRGLDTKAAARYLGLSVSWLRKARIGLTETPGPCFKKAGRKCIYPIDGLDKFLDS